MLLLPKKKKHDDFLRPTWNDAGDLPSSMVLQGRLLALILLRPQEVAALQVDEYTRSEMNRTGAWLCATLMVIPLLTLLYALHAEPVRWLQLIEPTGVFGLFLWALALGLAATVAVVCDRPILFFLTAMIAFFVGIIFGLLAVLVVEIWLNFARRYHSSWLGWLNVTILLVTHAAGILMIHAFVR